VGKAGENGDGEGIAAKAGENEEGEGIAASAEGIEDE
jgi:hypothetical protein